MEQGTDSDGARALKQFGWNRRFDHVTDGMRAEFVGRSVGVGTIRGCTVAGPASFKRLVRVAGAVTAAPGQSLPQRCDDWADLKAAYRFLSNPRVTPDAIQSPHRQLTRARCAEHSIVLVDQDTSPLDFTRRTKTRGLGRIGDGNGRGLLQHTALAVTPEREVLGVLHQMWTLCPEPPKGETRRERLARRKKTDVWSDTVAAIGTLPETRLIHVADQEADVYQMMMACVDAGVGFLIRGRHDRCVEGDATRLRSFMNQQAVVDHRAVEVPAAKKRPARRAKVALRYAPVTLEAPKYDPRFTEPLSVWAVSVKEVDPPADVTEPIDWLLLTSETTENVAAAWRRVEWYRCRWLVEEFHKVEKSGCKLEASQLDDAEDIKRLAAIVAVTAVRLLMLRGIVDRARERTDDSPTLLRMSVPWLWIVVVARADKKKPLDPRTLGLREFWLRIARRGGYIGRKSDGRPGWSTIWTGFREFMLMFQGAELMTEKPPLICG